MGVGCEKGRVSLLETDDLSLKVNFRHKLEYPNSELGHFRTPALLSITTINCHMSFFFDNTFNL